MKKVLIFGGARTGTTTLSHCLRHVGYSNGISDVIIDEPLNYPTRKPRLYNEQGDFILKCFQDAKLLHKFIVSESEQEHRNIVGKLTAGQLYRVLDEIYKKYTCMKHLHDTVFHINNKIILDYATDNNIKILLLERKDMFSAALSILMSKQSKQWHVLDDEARKKVDEYPFEAIPIHAIQEILNHSEKSGEQYGRDMKTKNLDYHTVCYEDFLHPDNDMDHRVETFKGILSYIDWEYNESETILQALSPKGKQYTDHHYNKIPNIEEIYRWRDDLSK